MRRQIVMLVSNACAPDRRVLREGQALAAGGHAVRVIAWDRQGKYAPQEVMGGVEIERIAVSAAYGSGLRRAASWPAFARRAWTRLTTTAWNAVHCHDLDTLPIGYAYTRRHAAPLVFDAHESYPDLAAPRLPTWATTGLRLLERFLVPRADALITVGELLATHYQPWAKRVVVVRNCPLPVDVPSDAAGFRARWGLEDVGLLLCYIGGFTHGRVILPLIDAVRAEPRVGLVLVGHGPQAGDILAAAEGVQRIVHLGERVAPEEVVPIMRACDVVYYGLRSDYPNNRFSSPNALYSALEAGRPLLTTDVGEISLVVRTEECGLVMAEPTADGVRAALAELSDPTLRVSMGRNARRAAETRYNWDSAKAALLDLYSDLWALR
jgi:glycosyltransferase involved in cell wall biosynthesis